MFLYILFLQATLNDSISSITTQIQNIEKSLSENVIKINLAREQNEQACDSMAEKQKKSGINNLCIYVFYCSATHSTIEEGYFYNLSNVSLYCPILCNLRQLRLWAIQSKKP